jgi:hypothetical protein
MRFGFLSPIIYYKNMKFIFKNLIKIFLLLAFLIGLSTPAVLAQQPASGQGLGLLTSSSSPQTDALTASAGFDTNIELSNIIATVIEIALGLLGVIFIVLIVLSGYQWMTAGGNEDVISKAQSRIKNAIIGLVIVLAAYAITAFVFSNLPQTGGAPQQIVP